MVKIIATKKRKRLFTKKRKQFGGYSLIKLYREVLAFFRRLCEKVYLCNETEATEATNTSVYPEQQALLNFCRKKIPYEEELLNNCGTINMMEITVSEFNELKTRIYHLKNIRVLLGEFINNNDSTNKMIKNIFNELISDTNKLNKSQKELLITLFKKNDTNVFFSFTDGVVRFLDHFKTQEDKRKAKNPNWTGYTARKQFDFLNKLLEEQNSTEDNIIVKYVDFHTKNRNSEELKKLLKLFIILSLDIDTQVDNLVDEWVHIFPLFADLINANTVKLDILPMYTYIDNRAVSTFLKSMFNIDDQQL
jgi:hypothetical protein